MKNKFISQNIFSRHSGTLKGINFGQYLVKSSIITDSILSISCSWFVFADHDDCRYTQIYTLDEIT
jgi:hypothetical protein